MCVRQESAYEFLVSPDRDATGSAIGIAGNSGQRFVQIRLPCLQPGLEIAPSGLIELDKSDT